MIRQNWLLFSALAIIIACGIGIYSWQQSDQRPMIDQPLPTAQAPDQPIFEINDPDPDVTRQIPLQVLTTKPQGEDVAKVFQISLTFNKPMIPLGDFGQLAQGIPIKVEPEIACQWRWVNRMSIACQLSEPLPPSTSFQIRVAAEITAYDKTKLGEDFVSNFSTQRWQVKREKIVWRDADLPTVYLTFNQSMNFDSLTDNISSECGPVKVEHINEAEKVEYSMAPERSIKVIFAKKLGLSRICQINIPGASKALYGNLSSKDYRYTFQTYPPFAISEINCSASNKATPKTGDKEIRLKNCIPNYGINIKFSAPAKSISLADNIVVEPFFGWSQGSYYSPEYYRQYPDREFSQISLRGPMAGQQTHRIEMGVIQDIFGRSLVGPRVLKIGTDNFYPELKSPSRFGVLEKEGPLELSYTATNIKSFDLYTSAGPARDGVGFWQQVESPSEFCKSSPFTNLNHQEIIPGIELNSSETLPFDLKKIAPSFAHGVFLRPLVHL